jgi:hypothetical protein
MATAIIFLKLPAPSSSTSNFSCTERTQASTVKKTNFNVPKACKPNLLSQEWKGMEHWRDRERERDRFRPDLSIKAGRNPTKLVKQKNKNKNKKKNKQTN